MTLDEILRELEQHAGRFRDVSGLSGDRTYHLDRDGGYYLKIGGPGQLRADAEALRYFAPCVYVPPVVGYRCADRDYLLTRELPGLPAAHPEQLKNPARLAEALGRILRRFHAQPMAGCPLRNSTADMLARAARNARRRHLDEAMAAYVGETDIDALCGYIQAHAAVLRDDVVLHGDYCLPNILLDDAYRLTGFLDLGAAGCGDRHYDLFWGRWSLQYNLKTDRYGDRFFDAYGRSAIDPQRLKVIGYIACLDE